MDFWLFIGRFHPMLVHMPIGLLLGVALLEAMAWRKKTTCFDPAVKSLLVFSFVMSVLSAGLGWALADTSKGGDALFWHRWLGIGLTVLLGVLSFLKCKTQKNHTYSILLITALGLLGYVGHLGGGLTHGERYLYRYMPEGLQHLLGVEKIVTQSIAGQEVMPQSNKAVLSYQRDIYPVLEKHCLKCHRETYVDKKGKTRKPKGGLRLDTLAMTLAGGDDGDCVVAHEPKKGSLMRLITLPEDDEDIMPPKGKPLTAEQIELFRQWIDGGLAR